MQRAELRVDPGGQAKSVLSAFLVGAAVSGVLVIGALIGAFTNPPQRLIAAALAFSSGALITSLAFDMFREAFQTAGILLAGSGLMAGAAVFVAMNQLIGRYAGSKAPAVNTLIDGLPESVVLGATLVGNSPLGIISLILSLFISNLPESTEGAVTMRKRGRSKNFVLAVWTVAALLLALTVFASNFALIGADQTLVAFIRAFAGGAVLASLSSNMMPKAYRDGGPFVSLATAAGFVLAFSLTLT